MSITVVHGGWSWLHHWCVEGIMVMVTENGWTLEAGSADLFLLHGGPGRDPQIHQGLLWL